MNLQRCIRRYYQNIFLRMFTRGKKLHKYQINTNTSTIGTINTNSIDSIGTIYNII